MRKRLTAALSEMRASIARAEALIEQGRHSEAVEVLEQARSDWGAAIEEVHEDDV